MIYYFKKFAKTKIQSESDAYVWLIYFVYCSLIDVNKHGGDFWDHLKKNIKEFNLNKRTIPRVKNSASIILNRLGTKAIDAEFSNPISKIKSLQAKNFRGFGSDFNGDDKGIYIEFDLNNTIFYGPNGSGKSSLCDALEYKLTGQVREAVRRNRRVTEYVKRLGSTSNPSLAISFYDATIDVESLTEEEKKYYSQAFIEKNRIQEFSLFGSKDTGIKKEQVLSILIGMDDLSDMAKSFVQPTAFKSNLTNFKRSEISNKILALNSANLSNTTSQKLFEDAIDEEKKKADVLLSRTDLTIQDLDEELEKINKEILAINADTISLSSVNVIPQSQSDFEDLIQSLEDKLKKYDDLNKILVAAKTDLSFLNLYTAIEELKTVVTNACPACNTPLTTVSKNPFTKASEELVKLNGVKDQEIELGKQKQLIEEDLKSVELLNKDFLSNIRNIPSLITHIHEDSFLNSTSQTYVFSTSNLITDIINSVRTDVARIGLYFSELDNTYKKQSQRQVMLASNNNRITLLNERKTSAESIKNNWQNSQKKLDDVNAILATYTANLASLNTEKTSEDNYNYFLDSLIATYPTFFSNIQSYKDLEFQKRFGNLETEIAGFYTQINKHDAKHDLIELFKINNSDADYKIEYQIKGTTVVEDASIKFSEGHLRSLGLAILLANAKINSLPFIIFDDVVNAIDSDHRANIIEMMVKDEYLKGVQQIVSTHDRLYWERFSIENQKSPFNSFILKCTEEGVVHYKYKLSFKEKIQSALDHFDIRQALLYSRIWFETIAKQFCMENNVELKGTLKPNEFHISIEPSLGAIYRVLNEKLIDNEHLKILHHDEINYQGINQEHHSFDEYNFNFIHSRTSHEVQKIFNAVCGLDDDIHFLKNHVIFLDNLISSFKKNNQSVNSLNTKMPLDFQLSVIEKRNENLLNIKDFVKNMIRLKIDASEISIAEAKINKVLIGIIISSLLVTKK